MDGHAIVVADPAGVIRAWDEGAERLFGHRAADAIGRTLDLIVPEPFRERHWAGFHRAMRTGESRLDRRSAVLPVRLASGEVRPVPATFYFLRDAEDRPAGAMGLYTPGADTAGLTSIG
jgi:PAS domain S-box-containing protein